MDAISKVHAEARSHWDKAGRRGLIAGATGIGKTKIALDRIKEIYEEIGSDAHVLVIVPTEKLRDEGWPDDAAKWSMKEEYESIVTGVCYVALDSMDDITQNFQELFGHWDFIVLDEGHHITKRTGAYLSECTYDEIMVLTATKPGYDTPGDKEKSAILDPIAPVVYEYPIEEAVHDGVVNDFHVHVVELKLDDKTKNIKAGGKKKTWFQTEQKTYDFLDHQTTKLRIQLSQKDVEYSMATIAGDDTTKLAKEREQLFIRHRIAVGARARFIYNLPSKTKRAKDILANILEKRPGQRTLVFCGSIEQSKQICGIQIFNSKSNDTYYEKFKKLEIDYLGVVNAVNEGANIPNLDFGLIAQVNSVERTLVQRIGRIIRKREGYTANIYILVVKDTVDERWAESALEGIDPSRITKYSQT